MWGPADPGSVTGNFSALPLCHIANIKKKSNESLKIFYFEILSCVFLQLTQPRVNKSTLLDIFKIKTYRFLTGLYVWLPQLHYKFVKYKNILTQV